MIPVVVGLGSNIDPERHLAAALRRLRNHPDLGVVATSRIYRSKPVGAPGTPDFLNAAVLVRTDLSPPELRRVLRGIEADLGRIRGPDPNAPRTIDLDLLLHGDLVEDFGGWEVPDPNLARHPHVALPAADVAPELRHPIEGTTLEELARRLDDGSVIPMGVSTNPDPFEAADFDDVRDYAAPVIEGSIRSLLAELGEDPKREGLRRTPLRVAKALEFLTSGYDATVAEVVNDAVFDAEGAEEMVLVKNIEYYSLCEHHLLPFFGKAAVAYLPKGKIIGLSKIARIVDVFARRLQVQERLTNQIADALTEILDPHGVAVVIEGRHLCMMMRGVQKQDSAMVTSAMRGTFKEDARTRSEFLDLVRD